MGNETPSWNEQVAIVTGAASGLGKAIAGALSEKGVTVALVDLPSDNLQAVQKELGAKAMAVPLDVTDEAAVGAAVQRVVDKAGRVDILVNAAGIVGETNIQSHDANLDDFRRVIDVNLYGSFNTFKAVIPGMLSRDYGRILNIASISGKEGNAGMLAYSTSKAAVIGMTKVQGKDYAETGIRINALAPAVVRTPMVDLVPPEQVKYMTDKIPSKRCGTLDEVAALVCFIVSPENSYTTAFTFDLSGGRATY